MKILRLFCAGGGDVSWAGSSAFYGALIRVGLL
jgi:hypothetical protein